MARLNGLRKSERAQVAKQIAICATHAARAAQLSEIPVHLAEEFEVWKLPAKASARPTTRLAKMAKPTGYWQHLVRHGGAAREIASSIREKATGKWKVHSLGSSILAEKLGEAIKWLDDNEHSDDVVRILLVPTFGLHALWLFCEENDRVLLFDTMKPVQGLAFERIYSGAEFLDAIFKEAQKLPSTAKLIKPPRKIRPRSPFKSNDGNFQDNR